MTVYKKNNKWYCRFQIRGKRKHFKCYGAKNKQEAENIETGFKYKLQQQQNGVVPEEKDKILLPKLYKAYENYTRLNNKNWKENVGRLKLIKTSWANKKHIEDIQPDDIEKLKTHLINLGRCQTTVNRYLELISKMFNIAIDNNWTDTNPIKKDVKFKLKNYQIRYASEEEEDKLYLHSKGILKDIIFIAFNTGLREANIIYLQGKNINLDFKMIEVTENKTNTHLKIPMNKKLYNFFKDKTFKPDEYIFKVERTGKPYALRTFNDDWNALKEKAGIVNFRFHDIRHTVATRLAKKRIPVDVIKKLLGHADIKTTMRYVHCADEQLCHAVELL